MRAKRKQITVAGRRISVSNLDKVLYPGEKFTKADVINYYVRVSKHLLPHLQNRPVTLKRFPDGVFGEFFYEKDAPAFTPSWVKTISVPRRETPGPDIRYIAINDLPTLVWLSSLANLEIHPFLHRAPRLDRPTSMVFDCDPGEGADILDCARVALMLREVLQELGLDSYVKVSGSKGLQVYVPLNSAVTYDETQPLAKALAELLAQREPKLIVSEMPKRLRTKKVFIDWSQNAQYKTTVSVYSLRAKTHRPYVSVPVEWEELDAALKRSDVDSLFFTPTQAVERLEEFGDLFKPVLKVKQTLPAEVRRYFAQERAPKSARPEALKPYEAKRDFRKTSEPKPTAPQRSRQGSRRRFVIQKHAASHLHYDFRLEMHDVLKSWSVPKGPPFKKDERRLAMPTEDHPVEYLDFEGIIPKGQYGGGMVMVWDIGTYEILEGNYFKGFLRVYLNGTKLKGEWTLKRFLDDTGKPSFWALQHSRFTPDDVYFYVFDLLALRGRDLRKLPLRDRRRLLERDALRRMRDPVRLSIGFNASANELIAAAKKAGLEGVIAKRASSRYESGERSGAWVKYKTNKGQELVIGGYKPGPNGFDYLLVGYYEQRELVFIAKIRNGFTPALRREVAQKFAALKTSRCPFANLPEPQSARRGEAITAEVMKNIQWLRPKLVAQIEFTEWTKGNHLRHSRFVGFREDKKAQEVIKES